MPHSSIIKLDALNTLYITGHTFHTLLFSINVLICTNTNKCLQGRMNLPTAANSADLSGQSFVYGIRVG